MIDIETLCHQSVLFSNFNVWFNWKGGEIYCKVTEHRWPGDCALNKCKAPTRMLRMRVIASGYTGLGPALMAHSALIWHQAQHSIPLTFISLFYAVCVYMCPLWLCGSPVHFLLGIQTENSPALKKQKKQNTDGRIGGGMLFQVPVRW